ncbi:hypothetical protein TIFTF001_026136 [Ficus carica]|uniref:Uncharacterized protein n=1 Tax=Ficus carica TaxID=3494 RepID=A0AA88ARS4_FICCA|nr:hypothetical protein TIFTF001_026136 [Ficus carica]
MMASKLPCVVPTRSRSGLVHGLSWIGLAASTTPWLRVTVSNLSVILDTRRWSLARLVVKLGKWSATRNNSPSFRPKNKRDGRNWFAGPEKSCEAVEGTGGNGDPSSRCCGCRQAHDLKSPNVDALRQPTSPLITQPPSVNSSSQGPIQGLRAAPSWVLGSIDLAKF